MPRKRSSLDEHSGAYVFFQKPSGALLLISVLVLGISGCAEQEKERAKETFATHHLDAEALYNYGIDALRGGRYKLASTQFEQLQKDYPYSGYVANAELMEGYAYYLHGDYPQSVQQLERYLQLHPTSPDAAYAFYLRALCYYEQIAPVSRDQLGTAEAMEALQEVVTRFPETSYARDAQLKIDLCRDHLAGKELMVGRYYQHQKQYQAALGRYQRVVQDFQTTNHVPEALERLVEVDLALGLLGEAQMAGAVLGYNYPGSVWYKDAYAHLKRRKDLLPAPDANNKNAANDKTAGLQVSESIAASSLSPLAGQGAKAAGTRPPLNPPGYKPPSAGFSPSGGLFTILGGGLSDGLDWFFDLAPPPPGSPEAAHNAAWGAAHRPKPRVRTRGRLGERIAAHPENKLIPSERQDIYLGKSTKPSSAPSASPKPLRTEPDQMPEEIQSNGFFPAAGSEPQFPDQKAEERNPSALPQETGSAQHFPEEKLPATATPKVKAESLEQLSPASKTAQRPAWPDTSTDQELPLEDLPPPPPPPSYPSPENETEQNPPEIPESSGTANAWAQMVTPDAKTIHEDPNRQNRKIKAGHPL